MRFVVAAQKIRARAGDILAANQRDMAEATRQGHDAAPFSIVSRSMSKRVEAMAKGSGRDCRPARSRRPPARTVRAPEWTC